MRRTMNLSPLSRTLAFAAPAVLLTAQRANAAGDIFLKIDSIDGEVTEKLHPKWIEVSSMSFGIANSGTVLSPGKSSALDLMISKGVDSSSPKLFLNCLTGAKYNEVKLEVTKTNSSGASLTYYRITLNNVLVKVVDASANVEAAMSEKISLSYGQIKIEYYAQDPKTGALSTTPVTAAWNFETNTK